MSARLPFEGRPLAERRRDLSSPRRALPMITARIPEIAQSPGSPIRSTNRVVAAMDTTMGLQHSELGLVWGRFRSALATYDGLSALESTEEREQRLDELAEVIAHYAEELRSRGARAERMRGLALVGQG
jgi:hypothetical protein